MNRDGANQSLWQSNMPPYQAANIPDPTTIYDVIIVGGGITGLTTALGLQKAGKQCLVLEGRTLCFGTTGGTTAHLNNFFDKTYSEIQSDFGKEGARAMATAANDALALYKKNIAEHQIDCDYLEADAVLFATDKKQAEQLDEILEASRAAGIAVQETDQIPIKSPFVKAIAYAAQGRVHPVKYVYGIARAFETLGGHIAQNSFVTGIENGEIISLQTRDVSYRGKKLLYATHIPPGINVLDLRCAPYRTYVLGIELADDAYPENPCYDMVDPYHYYRTHTINGKKYLVAGGEDHKTGHEEDTERPFTRLEHFLQGIFNIKKVAFKWSSQYFEPADGLAYIGHLPGAADNVFVATGFGGNGMTFSHIAANYFTTLFGEHKKLYDDIMSPARLKPVAGFSATVSAAADTVAAFIGDRFKIPDVKTVDGMAANSATILSDHHHPVAVYKNETGDLAALNPVCTHMHCRVRWNQTEKSWDCPCHGARYGVDGEVLTGPATMNLRQILLDR